MPVAFSPPRHRFHDARLFTVSHHRDDAEADTISPAANAAEKAAACFTMMIRCRTAFTRRTMPPGDLHNAANDTYERDRRHNRHGRGRHIFPACHGRAMAAKRAD